MLTIIGLGPGNPGQLTLEALDAMEGAGNLFLRTAVHPVVPYLEKRGIVFESFDALYEEKDSFEGVYQAIVDEILALAREKDVVYAVEDDGCGLPSEEIRHLFSDLGRTKEQADGGKRGMGIGLSVCYTIVKAHGGTMTAENLDSGGACFRFYLPLEEGINSEIEG